MNKGVSPTLIGSFVVGAVALSVIAVVMFGSGRLFRETREFVLYFDSSVNGLRIGAPVKFRGVEIGSVKDILLLLEKDMTVQRIPVIIEIDVEKLTGRGATGAVLRDPKAFKAAIDRGFRGQLVSESMVTGLLYVGVDIFPGSPANFVQPPGGKYPEIPTLPTAMEKAQDAVTEILAKLQKLDLNSVIIHTNELLSQTTVTVKSVNDLVQNPDLQATFRGANRLVNNPGLHSAVGSLEQTVGKVNTAVEAIQKLATNLQGNVGELGPEIKKTVVEARQALDQIEATASSLNAFLDPNSSIAYELAKALKEISGAARSVRLMSDYLERNPRAVIFGKPESETKP